MNVRKITSLTALLSFVLLILTSFVLYIVPAGRVAYWSDWRLWGLTKTQWSQVHLNLGVLMLLAICLHIYYNWKPITLYLKNKARQMTVFTRDFNMALLITVVFFLGTLLMVPPFSTIIVISENVKDKAALEYGEPPFGHAELATFKSLVQKTGLDLAQSLDLLKEKGLKIENPEQIFLEIAKMNQITPKKLYDAIRPADKVQSAGLPALPPPGTGNLTLVQLCEKSMLDIEKIRKVLEGKGLQVSTDIKLKEMAGQNNLSPIELYDIVRDISGRMIQ